MNWNFEDNRIYRKDDKGVLRAEANFVRNVIFGLCVGHGSLSIKFSKTSIGVLS